MGAVMVEVEDGRVTAFVEKSEAKSNQGLINGGVYLTQTGLLEGASWPERFSLEQDFLAQHCASRHFHGHISEGFFIDIGVPEDYKSAQSSPFFRSLS